jgi:hypothetical protein
VLGSAGWESKFVVAALSERGWMVDARLAVAPRLTVLAGTPTTIDTSVYHGCDRAGLDRGTPGGRDHPVCALRRRPHPGSGCCRSPGFSQSASRRARPCRGAFRPSSGTGDEPCRTADSGPRSAPAERGGAGAGERASRRCRRPSRQWASACARPGETWRWRMEGDESAMAAHRSWWAANVAAVAYVPVPRGKEAADPAPLASLYQSLGSPVNCRFGGQPGKFAFLGCAARRDGVPARRVASRRLRGPLRAISSPDSNCNQTLPCNFIPPRILVAPPSPTRRYHVPADANHPDAPSWPA